MEHHPEGRYLAILEQCQKDHISLDEFRQVIKARVPFKKDILFRNSEILKTLIRTQKIEILEYIIDKYNIGAKELRSGNLRLIYEACGVDNWRILVFLVERTNLRTNKSITKHILNLIRTCCDNNCVHNLRWLVAHFDSSLESNVDFRHELIWKTCSKGFKEIVEFIIVSFGLGKRRKLFQENYYEEHVADEHYKNDIHNIFEFSSLEMIQWFITFTAAHDHLIDLHRALVKACQSDKTEIVGFLFEFFEMAVGVKLTPEIGNFLIEKIQLGTRSEKMINFIAEKIPGTDNRSVPPAVIEQLAELIENGNVGSSEGAAAAASEGAAAAASEGGGSLDNIQAFVKEHNLNNKNITIDHKNILMTCACNGGDLNTIIWLDNHFKFRESNLHSESLHDYNAMSIALGFKHYDIAEWLIKRFNITKKDIITDDSYDTLLSLNYFEYNNMYSIQWIVDRFDITMDEIYFEFEPRDLVPMADAADDADDAVATDGADDADDADDNYIQINFRPDRVRMTGPDLGPKSASKLS
jgi:hypothetical protein